MQADLSLRKNIFWLSGGSGAGKSTIARRLAQKHGMVLYSSDETMASHAKRCSPEECPQLEEFKKMTMDERWVERSPEVMLDTFHWFNGEAFRFILDDLATLAERTRVIVEGFRLLPHLLKPHLASPRHAVWLIPTADFRRSAFESRGTLWNIANETSQPEVALQNLLKRDHLFSQRLERDVSTLGLKMIAVDGRFSEDDLLGAVEAHFAIQQNEDSRT